VVGIRSSAPLACLAGCLKPSGFRHGTLAGADIHRSFRKRINGGLLVETLEDRCLLSLNLTPYVNTNPAPTAHYGFTFDSGDVFPGATTPEGMGQFSPDNRADGTEAHPVPVRAGAK
jgi:hypothetical protein